MTKMIPDMERNKWKYSIVRLVCYMLSGTILTYYWLQWPKDKYHNHIIIPRATTIRIRQGDVAKNQIET